jgi:hypothetical protein
LDTDITDAVGVGKSRVERASIHAFLHTLLKVVDEVLNVVQYAHVKAIDEMVKGALHHKLGRIEL